MQYVSDIVQIKQIWYNMLIAELKMCWYADSVLQL